MKHKSQITLLLTATLPSNLLHPREMMSMIRAISSLKTRYGYKWLDNGKLSFSFSYLPKHRIIDPNAAMTTPSRHHKFFRVCLEKGGRDN